MEQIAIAILSVIALGAVYRLFVVESKLSELRAHVRYLEQRFDRANARTTNWVPVAPTDDALPVGEE